MNYYFAQFMPDPDQKNVWNVAFPDLPGCVTFGTGLQEAFESARDALEGYLDVSRSLGEAISPASDYTTAKALAEAQTREIGLEIPEGTMYQLVPAEMQPEPFVRLNISMQPRVVALIDRVAKAEGMTRSGFLAAAAKAYIHQISA